MLSSVPIGALVLPTTVNWWPAVAQMGERVPSLGVCVGSSPTSRTAGYRKDHMYTHITEREANATEPMPPLLPHVYVEFSIDGFHSWPNAPDKYWYLRGMHRHRFTFHVRMSVPHSERAVEINEFAAELEAYVRNQRARMTSFPEEIVVSFGTQSCEEIAADVTETLWHWFRPEHCSVTVKEDGILGGGVSY